MRPTLVSGRAWTTRRKWSSTLVWWARCVQRESCSTEPRAFIPYNHLSLFLSVCLSKHVRVCPSLPSLVYCLLDCLFVCSSSCFCLPEVFSPSVCTVLFFFCTAVQCFTHPVFRNLFELYFYIFWPAALCNNHTRAHETRSHACYLIVTHKILPIYYSPITS